MSTITEPCVRYDLDEAEYHADCVVGGSLSQSWAKKLLLPGGPARFWHDLHHRPPSTPAFDFGKATHAEVLGTGATWATSPYDSFRTQEAREWRDEQQAAGITVLSQEDAERIRAMVAALESNPAAMELLNGDPEVSMFTRRGGVMLRGRADLIGSHGIVDFKTTSRLAGEEQFAHEVMRYGYHQQAAWYIDQAKALDLCPPRFVFVVQETKPPHLVGLFELEPLLIDMGRDLNATAIDIYATCMRTGEWPGLPQQITTIIPPAWAYDDDIEMEAS